MRAIILILLLHLFSRSYSSVSCITTTYVSQIGVVEATNHNDGQQVEQYLATVGLGKGFAWCAAFVKWCLMQCGTPNTISAWAPSACNTKNMVFANQQWLQPPQPGDVFTIYSYSLKRVAHTGFFHKMRNNGVIETVEGNTNDNGSREGIGVFKRVRPLYSIHNISRWTLSYVNSLYEKITHYLPCGQRGVYCYHRLALT